MVFLAYEKRLVNFLWRLRIRLTDGSSLPVKIRNVSYLKIMVMQKKTSNPVVYSTEHGRVCSDCGKPVDDCICKMQKTLTRGDGIVRVGRETKGRQGKGVTVISGVPLDQVGLLELSKDLKKRCGTGGTVKDGRIEIQGDHRDMLVGELEKRGWRVKRCGG